MSYFAGVLLPLVILFCIYLVPIVLFVLATIFFVKWINTRKAIQRASVSGLGADNLSGKRKRNLILFISFISASVVFAAIITTILLVLVNQIMTSM